MSQSTHIPLSSVNLFIIFLQDNIPLPPLLENFSGIRTVIKYFYAIEHLSIMQRMKSADNKKYFL